MLFLVGKFFTNVHPLSFKTKKHWSDFLFGYFKVTRFHEDIFLFDFEEEVTKKLMKIRLWNVNEVISALTYKQQEAELLVEFKIDVVYGSEHSCL